MNILRPSRFYPFVPIYTRSKLLQFRALYSQSRLKRGGSARKPRDSMRDYLELQSGILLPDHNGDNFKSKQASPTHNESVGLMDSEWS